MGIRSILSSSISYFQRLSKLKLVEAIDSLRVRYLELVKEKELLERENSALSSQLKSLEEELSSLRSSSVHLKVSQVNKGVNQPSSKQVEWEEKGGKAKKKGRGKQGRQGSGNQPKNEKPTRKEYSKVDRCDSCGRDLSQSETLSSKNTRIIEDIESFPVSTEVIEVVQEKKYCMHCKRVVTSRSDLALPHSDIGLNTTVSLVYYWIWSCLSLPRIAGCMRTFFSMKLSTSGISSHLIRVSKIFRPVHEEILSDVKSGSVMHGDETGWRVLGRNWWLWVFGTKDSAFYHLDSSRGKDVVKKILGETFGGVLVVDGWRAYLSLVCEQQSCMAHLLRKLRKLHAAFPGLESVYHFYVKFRRILRDGERLQSQRDELGEEVFDRRLTRLHNRLDKLLEWPGPNEVLSDVIKKVKNQRPRILTFVEHPQVPNHNNFAEYLIRVGVLKRKISFGSKSQEGAEAYAVLLSIYSTCKLRNISFIEFIRQSLKHYTQYQTPLLLKEFTDKSESLDIAA